MVFSSVAFLFWFLPAMLTVYHLIPASLRNYWLLLGSMLFYTWGSGALVLLLIISTLADFWLGQAAYRARAAGSATAVRMAVLGSVVVNIGLLSYFKYSAFMVEQLNSVGDWFGVGRISWEGPILPIGISFFTFQSMSYTFDIARGHARPLRNPFDFALYVALFPQLVAGPIVRFTEISAEIESRETRVDALAGGVARFCHGLVKKVVIADTVAVIADAIFDAGGVSTGMAWLGLLAFSIQIYFDFSGYSDMAIGLGAMFGFSFPENFLRPYSALSVTDFWRRWHVTLSRWFRDYVYYPLGGSRGGAISTYRNLVVVFLLTGIWHGASWTFVIWGLFHGAVLLIERVSARRWATASPSLLVSRTRTVLLVSVGWVVFRAADLGAAISYLKKMAYPTAGSSEAVSAVLSSRSVAVLFLAAAVFLLPRSAALGPRLQSGELGWVRAYRLVVVLIGLPVASVLIVSGTFSPFLYFQF